MKRLIFTTLLLAACTPQGLDAMEVAANIDQHLGQRLTVRGKFKSGARCRIGEDGEWKTYCKDCQYCRGPLVLDVGVTKTSTSGEVIEDWPLVLGGVWEGKDIRCKGPLNQIECWPLVPGKTYVVQGFVETHQPPKLIVREFWEVD